MPDKKLKLCSDKKTSCGIKKGLSQHQIGNDNPTKIDIMTNIEIF